jgi:uroporphyrinogen decarboxylase
MTKPMSSRERVLTALANQEPDRVPVNYAANAGIDARLKAHFGLGPEDTEGLLRALAVDFRGVSPPYVGPRLHPELPGRAVDPQWGIHTRWIEHETGGYWDYCDFPLKDADLAAAEAWPMPSPDDYDYARVFEDCKRHKGYAIYIGGAGLGDLINSNGMARTMEQVLVDLVTDNPAGLRLIDRKLDVQLEVTRRSIEAARGRIDFVWLGEDLGSQNAPLISPSLFRKHIRPRHQKLVDLAKEYGLPVMIHTCGSSSWAFEDFIEMGINAVDTLQPEAKDMSPAHLKARFGGRLAFHGCISTRGPVAYGTVEDVIEDVRRTLGIMMPGGGYCLAPTHRLQDNSKTENVLAMYQAAHKYGRY